MYYPVAVRDDFSKWGTKCNRYVWLSFAKLEICIVELIIPISWRKWWGLAPLALNDEPPLGHYYRMLIYFLVIC